MMAKVIFYVVPQLRYGGGEKQFFLLLKYLDKNKFKPYVISLEEEGELVAPILGLGIEVFAFGGGKISQIKEMIVLFNKYKPDVVHTWLNNEWGRIACIFYRFLGSKVKIIASERDEMHSSNRRFKGAFVVLGRVLSFFSDVVTFNSPKAMNAFSVGVYKKNVCRFIGNGIESTEVVGFLSPPVERKIRLVMVGRLVSQKNHDFLLRAVSTYPNRHRLEILLVGDGPLAKQIQSRIFALGVGDVFSMLGKRSDIPDILRQSDVGLLLSSSEGFSNAVLEYLANGLAVILTDAGANAVCVKENGFVVESDDDVHKALDAFVENPNFLQECRENSLRLAREFFIEDIVSKYEEIY